MQSVRSVSCVVPGGAESGYRPAVPTGPHPQPRQRHGSYGYYNVLAAAIPDPTSTCPDDMVYLGEEFELPGERPLQYTVRPEPVPAYVTLDPRGCPGQVRVGLQRDPEVVYSMVDAVRMRAAQDAWCELRSSPRRVAGRELASREPRPVKSPAPVVRTLNKVYRRVSAAVRAYGRSK
jgi:hypothetical protein